MRSATFLSRALLLSGAVVSADAGAQNTDYSALAEVMGEPITKSVIGKPQRGSLVPADVTIITARQIATAAARDVPGLLQRHAGIDVTRFTAGQTEVTIRGGVQPYNPRLLVLVDGRQVYLDHLGITNWNLLGIELEDIQQIEVIRGPACALFGFNAVTGVVNIITRDGFGDRIAALQAEGGDPGVRRLAGILATPLGQRLALRISAGAAREDERRIPPTIFTTPTIDADGYIVDGVADSGPIRRENVSAALTWLPGSRTRLVASGGAAWNTQQELSDTYLVDRVRYETRFVAGRAEHDTSWGAVNARAYFNSLEARTRLDGVLPQDLRQRGLVTQVDAIVRLGRGHTARIGAEYRDNRLLPTNGVPAFSYRQLAGNVVLDVHPLRGVAVSLAGRVDRVLPRASIVDLGGDPRIARAESLTAGSFNAGLVAELGPRDRLRINGGRGLLLPSLIDIAVLGFLRAYEDEELGESLRVQPDANWSAEAGYRHDFSERLAIDATGFWSRRQQSYAFVFADLASSETAGASVTATGKVAPGLSWNANYTFLRVTPRVNDVDNARLYKRAPWLTTPRHRGNLTVDYDEGGFVSAGVAGRYVSASDQFTGTFVGGFVRIKETIAVDTRLRLRLAERFGIYALGENLTAARYATGSPIPADRRIRIGIEVRR